MSNVSFSVFTKPWKTNSLSDLAKFVKNLGFDGIEFPLREGYQVEPAAAEKGLPQLVKVMADYGLKVTSVAGSTDENVFAGCAAAGIPVIRIMAKIDESIGYMATVQKMQQDLEEKVLPLCEKYRVQVGVQNHYGKFICNAMGLLHLLGKYDPKYIGAVWDCAHNGLSGEEPEFALDIIWSHLSMVNLKNGFWQRMNGPEAAQAEWKRYFTSGTQGLASWPRVAEYLKNRGYQGVLCLTAEYSAESEVERLIREDIAYAKTLF